VRGDEPKKRKHTVSTLYIALIYLFGIMSQQEQISKFCNTFCLFARQEEVCLTMVDEAKDEMKEAVSKAADLLVSDIENGVFSLNGLQVIVITVSLF
jgi:hypothetical protein